MLNRLHDMTRDGVSLSSETKFVASHKSRAILMQVLLGGLSHWTVGLLGTAMAVACIIAADVGAYFFGKSWGRTKLTDISPKKTVEGAAGGLLCSTVTALTLSRLLQWPVNIFAAGVMVGTLHSRLQTSCTPGFLGRCHYPFEHLHM